MGRVMSACAVQAFFTRLLRIVRLKVRGGKCSMIYLPDGNQIKEADRHTICDLGIPSLELMEHAARSCVEVMEERKMDLSDVCIVCGSGNNGGDGFAIARMLLEKGYSVKAVLAGRMESRTSETVYQMEQFKKAGGTVSEWKPGKYSVIVDALFGVGLNRDIEGRYGELIEEMNQAGAVRFAVDVPSGISAADGRILGHAFHADVTVTFQRGKLGLYMDPGRQMAGEVIVTDIGIYTECLDADLHTACALEEKDIKKMMPERREDSHKGNYGRVLVIAGSKGMAGAAWLNAYAAYMTGAGLVQIYTAEENRMILQQLLPEAIIKTYELFDERELISLLRWADTVVIGSGIGTTDLAKKILRTTLEYVEVPCVIDADGLNLLAENPKYMKELRENRFVFTPHMKEMSRILKKPVSVLKENKREMLEEFVNNYPVTCVLKDARTLTACEGRHTALNLSGNYAMAKAGSGDVLAGIIGGLLSQGMEVYEAGVFGAYLHGLAGDAARKQKGAYSVMARDLAENLAVVLRRLEEI